MKQHGFVHVQSAINDIHALLIENKGRPSMLYIDSKEGYRIFLVFPYVVVPVVIEITDKVALIMCAKMKNGHIVYPLGKAILHQQIKPIIVGINESLTPIFLT